MVKELCRILKGKLADLPFIDVLAGLALTVTKTESVGEDLITTTSQRFPVSDDTNQDPQIFGTEINLLPEEGRRSIIYFEDFGISPTTTRGRSQVYEASLRLVCWMNREKLSIGLEPAATAIIEAAIIHRLISKQFENTGIFSRLSYTIIRMPPKDAGIFGRYTFDETNRQYLRPPFDFFAIDFTVSFELSASCNNNSAALPVIESPYFMRGLPGQPGPQGIPGPQGEPGPAGTGAGYFIHQQMIASDTWIVLHDLGYYPNVSVVDSANSKVYGDIRYNSVNQLTITFNSGFSGNAYLS